MAFESVRGYVGLASGLTELTRDRALEAARGLLALPAAGIASGSKVAVQAGALADEVFTAAATNRSDPKALVRSEVDIAITRLGLVPVQRLEDVQAEAARLRAEVARLRATSASSPAATTPTRTSPASKPAARVAKTSRKSPSAAQVKNAPVKKAQSARLAKKAQPAAKKAAKVTAPRRSSVTPRARPASA